MALSNKEQMRSAIREIVETLLLALVIYLVIQSLINTFEVRGASMEPSFHDGQRILVNKAVYFNFNPSQFAKFISFIKSTDEGQPVYLFHPPQRGDVIVFRPPYNSQEPFIKRIVGLPGETVEIREGKIYVDSRVITEPYTKDSPRYTVPPEQVPPDHYFVLGDNRNNSSDSHVWGMVPRENILGKAWVTYWPMSQLDMVPHYSQLPDTNK